MSAPLTFRKKPVPVQAMQFASEADGSIIAQWCGGTNENSPAEIQIPTLEGVMTARLGDWIIRGVRGEHYPCRGDIFAETYELCEAPQ